MNMTGDPNQQGRPTVFGYDSLYPTTADCSLAMASSAYNSEMPSGACITEAGTGSFPSNAYAHFSNQQATVPPSNNYSFYPNFSSAPSPMTFPFNPSSVYTQVRFGSSFHTHRCKRKTESPPPMHTKQHITDERMAEHLAKLHISSETPSTNIELESSDLRDRRLYMCEEMRKLQTTESIIPPSLLNKLERPCTALVLWTPPPRIVPLVHNDLANDDNNNNEDEMQDNNGMDLDMR